MGSPDSPTVEEKDDKGGNMSPQTPRSTNWIEKTLGSVIKQKRQLSEAAARDWTKRSLSGDDGWYAIFKTERTCVAGRTRPPGLSHSDSCSYNCVPEKLGVLVPNPPMGRREAALTQVPHLRYNGAATAPNRPAKHGSLGHPFLGRRGKPGGRSALFFCIIIVIIIMITQHSLPPGQAWTRVSETSLNSFSHFPFTDRHVSSP